MSGFHQSRSCLWQTCICLWGCDLDCVLSLSQMMRWHPRLLMGMPCQVWPLRRSKLTLRHPRRALRKKLNPRQMVMRAQVMFMPKLHAAWKEAIMLCIIMYKKTQVFILVRLSKESLIHMQNTCSRVSSQTRWCLHCVPILVLHLIFSSSHDSSALSPSAFMTDKFLLLWIVAVRSQIPFHLIHEITDACQLCVQRASPLFPNETFSWHITEKWICSSAT